MCSFVRMFVEVPDDGCHRADRDCSYFKVLPITASASLAVGSAIVPADPTTVLLEVIARLVMNTYGWMLRCQGSY